MNFSPEELRPTITPFLRSVCRYYLTLVQSIVESLDKIAANSSERLYPTPFFSTIKIIYSQKQFSHSLNLMGYPECLFSRSLSSIVSMLAPPPRDFAEEFYFAIRIQDAISACKACIIDDSISNILREQANTVSKDVVERIDSRATKSDALASKKLFQISIDFVKMTGSFMILYPQYVTAKDIELGNLILEEYLERVRQWTNRPEIIPPVAELCFQSDRGQLQAMIPPISAISQLDSELSELWYSTAGVRREPPIKQLAKYYRCYQEAPEDLTAARDYFISLVQLGPTISQELALKGLELSQELICKHYNSWFAHLIRAKTLWLYSESNNIRSELMNEIVQEFKLARELNTYENELYTTERLTRTIASMLFTVGRYKEALDEYHSEIFKPYKFKIENIYAQFDVYRMLGDQESQRRLVEEALSQNPEHPNRKTLQSILDKLQ